MRRRGWEKACTIIVLCAAAAIASPAQVTFTTLASFNGSNGVYSYAGLVQGTDGNFYGTTEYGGVGSFCLNEEGCGTVFKITAGGTLTTLYNFCAQANCADGEDAFAGLVQATDGNFYGTTEGGGNGFGTVFKLTPEGALTTLYSFCPVEGCADGESPSAGLVQATDGNFYGTTTGGGSNSSGTVFKITAGGALTTIYNFCAQANCTDGLSPEGGVVQGTDGNFYGTTEGGGNETCDGGCGTIFKVTPTGTLTTLYSFQGSDGFNPIADLVQGTDGNFYGGAFAGGADNGGTLFRITSAGALTTLYSFCSQPNCSDGESPDGALVQASDGNFYGTTTIGGAHFDGTAFKITTAGALTTLYSFCAQTNCTDGSEPRGGLIQASDGIFYGTTQSGGIINEQCEGGCGTVFSLVVPLPVATLAPTSLNFGNQPVGVPSSPLPIKLTNTGGENLLITSIVDANGFSQTNNCPVPPATLTPTSFCTINVTFTPASPGNASSTLVITDNVIGSPQMLPLSGVGGSAEPVASLAPTGLNFNTQLLGTTSTPQAVTLKNTGGAALTITSISFIGTDPGDFKQSNNCGNSLAAGNSCTINVSFNPTTPGVSNASATLVVADNASPSPQSTMVTGVAQTYSLTTNCTSLTVVPGQTAIYTVQLAPENGFAQSVALSCSGAPALAKCTVNPSSVTLDGQTTIQAQVTATTTPATSGFLQSPFGRRDGNRLAGLIGLAGLSGLAALVVLPGKRRVKQARRLWALVFCLCMLSTMATMSSCGGGGGAGTDPPGTAAGTYPLTVTATFQSGNGGTFTQKVSFDLVVQ